MNHLGRLRRPKTTAKLATAEPVSPGLPRGSDPSITGRRATSPSAPAEPWSRITRLVGAPRRFVMSPRHLLIHNLAAAFLAGAWTLDDLVELGTEALGKR